MGRLPDGRWDGNTFVVDTTNFTDRTNFRGSSEQMHLVERFTRVDASTLLYEFTVDDPASFIKPWSAALPPGAPCLLPLWEKVARSAG